MAAAAHFEGRRRAMNALDRKLSMLGHSGADFAHHAMMYRKLPYIFAGLGGSEPAALGIAGGDAFLAAYCQRRGPVDLPGYDLDFAFNFFRLAAIFHGITGRAIAGDASCAQVRERAAVPSELVRLAWQQAERAGAR